MKEQKWRGSREAAALNVARRKPMTRAEGLFGAEKGHGSFVKAVCTRMRRRESGPPEKAEERNVLRAFQKNQVAGAPRSSTVDDLRKHRTGDQAAARGPMLKQILGVGGWTLVSRVTGLVRDIVLSAVLGDNSSMMTSG